MMDFSHKYLIPPRPAHLISRPSLNELLAKIKDRQLITISAPAGYGKTSLLIDFADSPPLPICWYTLDSSDQDPWVFLEYLAASVDNRFPDALKQTRALLDSQGRSSFTSSVTALTREIYAISKDFAIIIDDWHLVDQLDEINEIIAMLLRRCPNCHVVLASRTYPSLPNITLLVARRQMLGLNENHLRFGTDEVMQVLRKGRITTLDAKAADLVNQYNGWITGILLSLTADLPSAESLSADQPAGPSYADVWAERQVYRFLAEQVFDLQPPELRTFLLESSLLDRLTPEDCDTYLNRTDSRWLLDMLRRRYLFVSEVDRGILCYHPTFREFLQEHFHTLNHDGYCALASRVANIYAENQQWLLAFKTYTAIPDFAAAQRIIISGSEQLYRTGRLETLEYWFTLFPSEDDLDVPLLCLKAQVMIDRGRFHEAELLIRRAQARQQPVDKITIMLLQAQMERIAGHYEAAIDIARHVLEPTPDLAPQSRAEAQAQRLIGICHNRLGQPELAIEKFEAALKIEEQRGDLYEIAQLQRDLGLCYRGIGHLRPAESYFTKADTYWASLGNIGLRAMSLNSKGTIQHLAGRYREAYDTFTTALQYIREAALPAKEAIVLSCIGDLYCDLQLWEQAELMYADARKLANTAHTISDLDIAQVRLLCGSGQFEAAEQALARLPQTLQQHQSRVVKLLGVVSMCGLGSHALAAQHIQEVITALSEFGNSMDLARAHLLHAEILAKTAPHDSAAFLAALQQAAAIADNLGHDAFLVVETQRIPHILRQAEGLHWMRATDWLRRQAEIVIVRQAPQQELQLPLLIVRTLGVDQIIYQGRVVEFAWQKAREIFFYLLAYPEGVPVEILRENIWPNLQTKQRSDRLRTAIYQLRSELARDLIELQGRQIYRLNRTSVRLDYDVEQFLQRLDSGVDQLEMLREALDIYRGQYLAALDAQWCIGLRSHLEQRYLHALQLAADKLVDPQLHLAVDKLMDRQMYIEALSFYQRILEVDNLNENAYAGIMRCQMALGNRGAAINQYQLLRRVLDDELGLVPETSSDAEQLFRQILELEPIPKPHSE